MIQTPSGTGKFISYDPITQTCIVEMDFMYLVEFDANECIVI